MNPSIDCDVLRPELAAQSIDPSIDCEVVEHLEMESVNVQTKNIVAASSGTSAEEDVFMIPNPHQPLIREGHCDENGPKSYPVSPLPWVPVSPPIRSNDQRIGAVENSDHIALTVPEPQMDHTASSVPESQICRICAFDEEEDDDDVLVELGCSCKGELSRMHRKCILKWYGVRMLLENLYECELCNTVLHPKAQLIVARGVTDHENGGRATLMNALKSSLASYAPQIEVERAANYKELVQLLLDEKAEYWYRHRRQVIVHINEAQAANSNSQLQEEEEAAAEPELTVPPACGRGALILSIGAIVVSVGLYLFLLHHLYGNVGYN